MRKREGDQRTTFAVSASGEGEGLELYQDTLVVLGGHECWRAVFIDSDGKIARGASAAAAGWGWTAASPTPQ